jgi:hypothetical protein
MQKNFNFLWKLYQIESKVGIDFEAFLDYSKFSEEWKANLRSLMGDAFDLEFPFGKEGIELKQYDQTTVIRFSNLPRQCGRTTLCAKFCKQFLHSIYFNPHGTVAKHKEMAHGIKARRCSRPRDLQNLRGYRFNAICFDDFNEAEDTNLERYLNVLLPLMSMNGPSVILIVD